jgi:hypothetical protein
MVGTCIRRCTFALTKTTWPAIDEMAPVLIADMLDDYQKPFGGFRGSMKPGVTAET